MTRVTSTLSVLSASRIRTVAFWYSWMISMSKSLSEDRKGTSTEVTGEVRISIFFLATPTLRVKSFSLDWKSPTAFPEKRTR